MADELIKCTISLNGGTPHPFNRGIYGSAHPKHGNGDVSLCMLNKAILFNEASCCKIDELLNKRQYRRIRIRIGYNQGLDALMDEKIYKKVFMTGQTRK